jgi:hypothetical protein
MNTEKNPVWEILLPQNVGKERREIPDFTAEGALIGTSLFDIGAWFGEIKKGNNRGRPYLGLALNSKGNASQKITVSLWEKLNRMAEIDPHFTAREQLNGQDLRFSAWVESAGSSLHVLRLRIEPFSVGAEDLNDAALETQNRLTSFLKEARLRLPNAQQPELPIGATAKKKRGSETDTEPDDIPFKTTVYKDVRNSQLNRRVL